MREICDSGRTRTNGAYCYCKQHLRPHTTGWCTVSPKEKEPLKATTMEEAVAEVEAHGWEIYRGDAYASYPVSTGLRSK